jgi:hypothetical protein
LSDEVIEDNVAAVEIKVQKIIEIKEEIKEASSVTLTEEEEREEGILAEWLLGTYLTYKSVRNLVNSIKNEEKEVDQIKSDDGIDDVDDDDDDDDDDVFVETQEIVTIENNPIQV